MSRFDEWTEERWPRHTMRYWPQRFICQMLALLVIELAILIVLVAA